MAKRKKPTFEDMAKAQLARVKKKMRAQQQSDDCLYGAQQALEWLLDPKNVAAPSLVFPLTRIVQS